MTWSCCRHQVVASVKASNAQGSEIHQVEPNPTDSSVVAVVADGLLRLYKVQDNTFKTIPLSFKRDPQVSVIQAAVC